MQDNRKIINYITEYKCFNEKILKLGEMTVVPLQLNKVFLSPHLMLTIKDALIQNIDYLKIIDVTIYPYRSVKNINFEIGKTTNYEEDRKNVSIYYRFKEKKKKEKPMDKFFKSVNKAVLGGKKEGGDEGNKKVESSQDASFDVLYTNEALCKAFEKGELSEMLEKAQKISAKAF